MRFNGHFIIRSTLFTILGKKQFYAQGTFSPPANMLSRELEKLYNKTLNLAWQQINPPEMKSVAEQAKKADNKQ